MEDLPPIKKYPCAIEKEEERDQKSFKYLDDLFSTTFLDKYYKIELKKKDGDKRKCR